ALVRQQAYDLVLLDEQMPGRRGLDVLVELRRTEPDARVVMITKSEEDRTLMEAIGRRVDDYLVKPATPRQVLSVATRLLEGAQLRQQQAAQDFAARFAALTRLRNEATSWQDYFSLYHELVNWDLRLHDAGETALADSVAALMMDVRREFGALVVREYAGGGGAADGTGSRPARAAQSADRPPLSTDVVERYVAPHVGKGPLLFVIIDCLRLDQWRVLRPLLAGEFDVSEELYLSILP